MRQKIKLELAVYIVKFKNYHKVYIGSTHRWPKRKREHFRDLRKNGHDNKYLQNASNKYDIENITIEVLEICNNTKNLLKQEKFWMDFYKSCDNKYGFNLVKDPIIGGAYGHKKTKKQRRNSSMSKCEIQYFYNPLGQLIEIQHLKDFCKENDLDYSCMMQLKRGKAVEHKGWKSKSDATYKYHRKIFEFYDKNNNKIICNDLRNFCNEKNLDYKSMHQAIIGKSAQHQGYKINPERKDKNIHYYKIKNPKGEIVEFCGLKKFCKKNNLNRQYLSWVINGKKKEYKGYTKA